MNKYISMLLIIVLGFVVLVATLFAEYSFSDMEKVIYAVVLACVSAYLFKMVLDSKRTVERLLKAAKISQVGFWTLDHTKHTLFWSDEIFDMFEIDKNRFNPSYEKFLDVIYPDDRDLVNDAYLKSLENKQDYVIQHRLLMNDKSVKWVKEKCQTDFDKNGRPIISVGIVTEITQEMEYVHAIEKSEKTLNSIMNSIDDLIFFKDKDFNYLGCNKAFEKFVGKSKENIIGKKDFELFSEEDALQFRAMDMRILETNTIRSNYEWITYPEGEKQYVLVKKIPFNYTNEEIGILGISRDITQMYLVQQQKEALSYIDELTRLHNRKAYNERIEELLAIKKRYHSPFSMMMYDIDNFKHINDTYGHRIGDNVLIQMSELIKSHLRESDYIFRIGGEEFVILLTQTTVIDADKVAAKICKLVEENLKHLTNQAITISIGLSEANESDTEDTIFRRVDTLLYRSKTNGKNRVTSDITQS